MQMHVGLLKLDLETCTKLNELQTYSSIGFNLNLNVIIIFFYDENDHEDVNQNG